MGGLCVLLLSAVVAAIYYFFIAVLAAIIFYTLVSYVLESFAAMRMGENLNYKVKFAAWIPVYNKYILGRIAENKALGGISGVLTLAEVCLCIYFYFNREINTALFILLIVCVIITFIIDTVISHKLFLQRINKNADILTAVNVITLGILRPVFLFALRNRLDKAQTTPASE